MVQEVLTGAFLINFEYAIFLCAESSACLPERYTVSISLRSKSSDTSKALSNSFLVFSFWLARSFFSRSSFSSEVSSEWSSSFFVSSSSFLSGLSSETSGFSSVGAGYTTGAGAALGLVAVWSDWSTGAELPASLVAFAVGVTTGYTVLSVSSKIRCYASDAQLLIKATSRQIFKTFIKFN